MAEALDFRDPDWVAEQLNIDKNAVYRYLNEGLLPGLQLGRKWLVSESSLVEFLKAEEKRQTLARRQFGAGLPGDLELKGRYDRFSQRARHSLIAAEREARDHSHNYIGQEHLLLGITASQGSVGLAILAGLGVSAQQVRTAVEEAIGPYPTGTPVTGEIGLTPRAKRAIELAVDEARRLNHGYVGDEHLLIGLLREGGGVGYGVLSSLGITVDRASAELHRLLALPSGDRMRQAALATEEEQPASNAATTEEGSLKQTEEQTVEQTETAE